MIPFVRLHMMSLKASLVAIGFYLCFNGRIVLPHENVEVANNRKILDSFSVR